MKIYDVIVLGSGAAGAWAARQLKTKNVLMIDVGRQPEVAYSSQIENYFDLKKSPEKGESILIGKNFESLSNVFEEYQSPKLKSPYMKYVVSSLPGTQIEEKGFHAQQSFAMGGLGNAWGAGCFRFQDFELESFPITSNDLDPYYDILTKEIGISGCDDDLTRFYGTTRDLLPAIKKTTQMDHIYGTYLRKKSLFHSRGFYIGHPRLAYKNYRPQGLDYYLSHNPSIYTPAYTVQKLIQEKKIEYKGGFYVESFLEKPDCVEVVAKNLSQNKIENFKGKILIVALGALNSAKCVLGSYKDYHTRLPLLDNNISYVPFLYPRLLGLSWAMENVIGSHMTMVKLRSGQMPLQVSIYNVGSVLISDLLYSLPLSADVLARAAKLVIPALIVAQVFYPDSKNENNFLSLKEDNHLRLHYEKTSAGSDEGEIIRQFFSLGLFSSKALIQYPTPGNSFHYAGMLPMKENPKSRYECHKDGRLYDSKRVFIADAANFPDLPAKNHTFTIMANSMRISDEIQNKYLGVL